MIDFLTVIYKNYDLVLLQVENFVKRFNREDYRLIIVDNTPNNEKKYINIGPEYIDKIIYLNSFEGTFDGISHGGAIEAGLHYCESDIICIFDSDFFFLNSDIISYIKQKFNDGYVAVGCEWNDGRDTKKFTEKNPSLFENIPCCFGAFYDAKLARAASWIVTPHEVAENLNSGFVEVGWKVRKFILDNKLKTLSWKTDANNYGECYFKNDKESIMGIHYVAGSHIRSAFSIENIRNILEMNYV